MTLRPLPIIALVLVARVSHSDAQAVDGAHENSDWVDDSRHSLVVAHAAGRELSRVHHASPSLRVNTCSTVVPNTRAIRIARTSDGT